MHCSDSNILLSNADHCIRTLEHCISVHWGIRTLHCTARIALQCGQLHCTGCCWRHVCCPTHSYPHLTPSALHFIIVHDHDGDDNGGDEDETPIQPKSSLTPPLQLFWPHLRRRPDNHDEGHHHLHNWISTSQPWQDVCDFSFKALRLHSVCFGIRDSCLWSLLGGITDLRICPRCHKSAENPKEIQLSLLNKSSSVSPGKSYCPRGALCARCTVTAAAMRTQPQFLPTWENKVFFVVGRVGWSVVMALTVENRAVILCWLNF